MTRYRTGMNRRGFLFASCSTAAALLVPSIRGKDQDPWSKKELMEPGELAALLNRKAPTRVICVAFPVLYRQRHIWSAILAGPASKAEGIADLHSAVAGLPKNAAIVIYCGCCPMKDCPNIRPAFRTLKEMGFADVRVLDLPTNLHTDWTLKGYPVA